MTHWKELATRCAVVGCENTRAKGWSTCSRREHYQLGKRLKGAGRIEPITLLKPDMDALEERLIEQYRGDNAGRASDFRRLEWPKQ